jgi:hypothetical protein
MVSRRAGPRCRPTAADRTRPRRDGSCSSVPCPGTARDIPLDHQSFSIQSALPSPFPGPIRMLVSPGGAPAAPGLPADGATRSAGGRLRPYAAHARRGRGRAGARPHRGRALDRLRVHDPGLGHRVTPNRIPCLVPQPGVHPFQHTLLTPPGEVPEYRLPRRKITGQMPPRTPGPNHIEDRVHDVPVSMPRLRPILTTRRQQRLDQRPLLIRQVGSGTAVDHLKKSPRPQTDDPTDATTADTPTKIQNAF